MGMSDKMTHGSLFSGQGGFDLAAAWMGWENKFHCEWNTTLQKVLNFYWSNAITYDDITKTDFSIWRGKIDILTGGFPCQPYSAAGKRKGKEDDRHLWPEMLRAIREIAPKWVVGENVLGLVNWNGGLVFEEVCVDLEAEGYEVQPYVLPAAGVGAPHQRYRVFFVAYFNNGSGQEHGLSTGREVSEDRIKGNRVTTDTASQGREARKQRRKEDEEKIGSGMDNRLERLGGERSIADSEMCNKQRDGVREEQQEGEIGGQNCNVISNTHGGRQSVEEHRKEEPGRITETSVSDYWQDFPTVSPVLSGDDGISGGSHFETISEQHNMDRDLVIKGALESGRLEVDVATGKIFSRTIRGRKGEKVELLGSDCNGYRVHNIYYDGVKKQCRAHQIVWISVNGLYDKSELMIDHINRDRSDNRINNLRLVDAKGNRENATPYEGKFTQEKKDVMHELHTKGNMSFRELAMHFECSKSRVHQIVTEHSGIYSISYAKWRNESIKAAGNAIVPQVVLQIFKAIEAYGK
jgi:DNA (cytosine-5)-methyltransferase 1